jgi:hypothetical protein
MEMTKWEINEKRDFGNTSKCKKCGIEGTNYSMDCPNIAEV